MAKQIIFSLPGQISKRDKARMMGNGVLVVEVKDFSKIKQVQELDPVSSNDIFNAALKAISESGEYTRSRLGWWVMNTAIKRQEKTEPSYQTKPQSHD